MVRGYRKRKRMQKRRKMMKRIYISTFLFAICLLIYTAIIYISPSITSAHVSTLFTNTTNFIFDTVSKFSSKISPKVFDYVSAIKTFISVGPLF